MSVPENYGLYHKFFRYVGISSHKLNSRVESRNLPFCATKRASNYLFVQSNFDEIMASFARNIDLT